MMRSLRARITTLTLACIGVLLVPFAIASYLKIVEEVNELSDARLAESAKTLEAVADRVGGAGATLEVPVWHRPRHAPEESQQGHGYETQIGFQYWRSPGELSIASADLRDLPFDAAPIGFADIRIERRHWRIFTMVGAHGGFVRAGERYDSRREIIRDLLLQNALPIVIGLPILALAVGWSVRRGLKPLEFIAAAIERRSPDAVAPIDSHHAPREVEPLIRALNGLMRRLRDILRRERAFTSNAAHELRTPLAGALVHVDNAANADDEIERRRALAEARSSLERLGRLVGQMLELARWDNAGDLERERILLAPLVDEELAGLAPAAIARDVALTRRIEPASLAIRGWEPGIRALVRNLVDNAIRHGRAGGHVVLTCTEQDDSVEIRIEDDGPGLAPGECEAIIERSGGFGNAKGHGLGLAIVARIAELHGADIECGRSELGGLSLGVRFGSNRAPRA